MYWDHSLFSYHCGIMSEINIKRYLKITYIFSSAMWHLPRDVFDLAIERLNKFKRLIKHRGWLQRRKHLNEKLVSKWEFNVKYTLNKTPFIWKINVHLKLMSVSKKPLHWKLENICNNENEKIIYHNMLHAVETAQCNYNVEF